MLIQQRKPTATELLKALHNAWLLGPSSNNGNVNSGADDADDGKPTDVALTQLGGFTKAFSRNCFKCGKKGHMAKDCTSAGGGNNNNAGGGGSGGGKGKGGGGFKGDCNFCGKPGHMSRNCFSNPESSQFKGKKEEAAGASVEVLIPSIEEELGVEFMLSSLDEELETVQGNNEPKEQPSVVGSGPIMQPGDRSSAGATRYAAVQGAVLAYEIERLAEDYPSLMPSLQINTDASYAATFESDREQAIDLFRTARNNARFMDTKEDEDSSVGMPDLSPGDEESSDSDEESSVGMPDLIDRHDDSSEEDTIQDSIGSSELRSVTESDTTVIEDSSVEESSVGTNESPMIQIENLEMVEEAVPG